MSSLPVYATLDFPTATSFPSLTCLQWTAEGQLVFATKSAAYILVLLSLLTSQVHGAIFQTPEYGITYDTASAIKHTSKKENVILHQGIGWFMTIVQLDMNETLKWSEYSQGESLYTVFAVFLLIFF